MHDPLQVLTYIRQNLPGVEETTEATDNPVNLKKITEETFQHEDKDRDGFISYEEFSGPKHDEL